MAENVAITPGSGDSVAADDIGSVKFQRIKLIHGADGTNDGDVSSANGLPVDATGQGDVPITLDSEAVVLGAGSAAIGKLAANSGVDIGDVDVASCALPTGAATAAKQLADGHSVALSATDAAKMPVLGQALAAASVPVVMPAADISTLTPPAAITGFALEAGGNLADVATDTDTIAGDTTSIDGKITACNTGAVVLAAGTAGIGKLTANSGVDIGDVDVASIAAGNNNIGDVDVASIANASINGPGVPVIDSYTSDDVNLAANTANQAIIAAPGANKQIWIYGLVGTADVAGTISIQDEDDTALSGVMPVGITGGFVMNPSGNFSMPWIKVATNKAVEIDTVTCTFDGIVIYAIVSV